VTDTNVIPTPHCKRCGHTPCPSCVVWCDNMVWINEGDEFPESCCDGECEWDQPDDVVEAWCEAQRAKEVL